MSGQGSGGPEEAEAGTVERLVAGVTAGLLCFLATAGAFALWSDFPEGWSFVAGSIALPASFLALLRRAARLIFFFFGLLAYGIDFLLNPGPHDPTGLIPFFGWCLMIGAVAAEGVLRVFQLVRRGRAGARSPRP